jgi:SAM-dependent methyltransferase
MSLRDKVIGAVVSQFSQPRGVAGRLVGWEMALRRSNRNRNRWAVELLDVQPADRFLEIGFGPGIAIREAASRAVEGYVAGVDHSKVMVRQATRRNRAAVREGRVDLRLGSSDTLPAFDQPFDKVLAVNTLGMWPDPAARLEELRSRMRDGGLIGVVSQPRCPGATAEHTARAGTEIRTMLETAGFSHLRSETLDLDPPVVCVLAKK